MTTTYTVKVDDHGTKHWYQNNKLHRTDGPACEDANGTKEWYLDDKLHRTDGPAIEGSDGSKHWFLDDKRHRTDGPAIEYANGGKLWFLDGKELTQAQWKQAVKPKVASCAGKVVEVDGVKYRLIAA
jgi:hypothetical protein